MNFEAITMNGPDIHPGEHVKDLLDDYALSANALALRLGVPANRISAILKEQRGISADTALRLAKCFGSSPEYWLNLQRNYDLRRAYRDGHDALEQIKPLTEAA